MDSGIVNIHGKQYKTVALRVQEFFDSYPDRKFGIVTEILSRDEVQVCVKATIVDTSSGVVIATGHAEEFRRAGNINRTSALENAETSAIGRALAAFGFGGSEFASANEVQTAIQQQSEAIAPEKIMAIRALLESGDIKEWHLEKAFGHSVVEKLLDVEADRILNGVRKSGKSTKVEE
jgi:hypothetical protein